MANYLSFPPYKSTDIPNSAGPICLGVTCEPQKTSDAFQTAKLLLCFRWKVILILKLFLPQI